jgi:AAA domain, putative AbiEii toxin, Type IV TA system/AAA ATPase domain
MLKSIEIHNFRSCRSTNIVFADNVSALVGKNGVGKTNILRCIEWLVNLGRFSGPIRIESPREARPGDEGFSVRVILDLDGAEFLYSFVAPSIPELVENKGNFIVEERLERRSPSDLVEVFARKGERIRLNGSESQILISQFSSAIGALSSLLSADDPVRSLLDPIASFFSGVHYYPLEDRAEASDLIPEKAYNDWVQWIQRGQASTESIGLRLIYMMKEKEEMFAEFQALTGPQGLDLITKSELVEISSAHGVKHNIPRSTPLAETYFYPAFEPAAHLGGAGILFPLSQLSVGTRRAIRAITALLFDQRSLMLMEQPEDSIHPGLLGKLIDLLRSYSARTQIVFTTHSPDVLDLLEPDEVMLISAPGGKTTAHRLSAREIRGAKRFLKEKGSLSEYIEISSA